MIMNLLAETSGVSGELLIKVIGAIFTGVALLLGGRHIGKKEAQGITLQNPVPQLDVTTREHPDFVTHGQLNGHLDRIESTFEEIKEALGGERDVARVANGNIHKRIDSLSDRLVDRLANLEGSSKSVKETVDKLLDIALGKKPTPRG